MLAARCKYFMGSFFKMRESKEKEVKFMLGESEPTSTAVESFIKFCYTGSSEMKIQDSVYLLTASSYYGMKNDRLRELCASRKNGKKKCLICENSYCKESPKDGKC